jgi:hypothetical protein
LRHKGQVELRRLRRVWNRQAAADVDGLDGADVIGQPGQVRIDAAPVLRILDAAAQVRVQTADAHAEPARLLEEGVEARHWQAELGGHAAGADLLVVALAVAQVDAQPDRAAAEHLRPTLQRFDVVERDDDAALERRLVFAPRREARGEQHAARVDLRQRGEHALDLAQRHAFQAEAFTDDGLEDGRGADWP